MRIGKLRPRGEKHIYTKQECIDALILFYNLTGNASDRSYRLWRMTYTESKKIPWQYTIFRHLGFWPKKAELREWANGKINESND